MVHWRIFFAFFLTAALPGFGQAAINSGAGLPEDPGGVFAAIASSYDYSTLKPWHLKATYQLYDDAGKPTEQGTYEYWSASKQVFRSSWTRGSATYTEWHMADGQVAYQGKSELLNYFEHKLAVAFLSPLTSAGELDSTKFRLDDHAVTAPGSVVSCYNTVPVAPTEDHTQTPSSGLFPQYCFNTKKQLLLGIYSFGGQVVKFNAFTQIEGKNLAHMVYFREDTHDILSAQVDAIGAISPSDPELTPPPSAKTARIDKVQVGADVAEGLLVKKVAPVYPQEAKDVHVQGKVILQAFIGIDGRVRGLQLLSAPAASLASSAFWSVSQWQYKPYLRNGVPVEVETTITVSYPPRK
jgi:TonB family protein